METSTPSVSPLRQRMIEDMRMRKLGEKTQVAYIRAVRKLAAYLKRSPATATVEELRRFQLHLVDQGTSPVTLKLPPVIASVPAFTPAVVSAPPIVAAPVVCNVETPVKPLPLASTSAALNSTSFTVVPSAGS